MASSELIVDDEYCKSMGIYFIKEGQQFDEIIADYARIMQDVKDKAIISGEVSNALSAYLSYVKKLSNDYKIETTSKSISEKIDDFLAKIDEEDKYLF